MKHISETIFSLFGGDPKTMDLPRIFQKTREVLPIDCLLAEQNIFPLRMVVAVRIALDLAAEIPAEELCEHCILLKKCDETAVFTA